MINLKEYLKRKEASGTLDATDRATLDKIKQDEESAKRLKAFDDEAMDWAEQQPIR